DWWCDEVGKVSEVCEPPQGKLKDEVVAGFEVELVLSVVRPLGEQACAAGGEESDGPRDQHDGFDDALDDDDLDEGVVLAAHAAELGPEAGEVMRPFFRRGVSQSLVTLTSWV